MSFIEIKSQNPSLLLPLLKIINSTGFYSEHNKKTKPIQFVVGKYKKKNREMLSCCRVETSFLLTHVPLNRVRPKHIKLMCVITFHRKWIRKYVGCESEFIERKWEMGIFIRNKNAPFSRSEPLTRLILQKFISNLFQFFSLFLFLSQN